MPSDKPRDPRSTSDFRHRRRVAKRGRVPRALDSARGCVVRFCSTRRPSLVQRPSLPGHRGGKSLDSSARGDRSGYESGSWVCVFRRGEHHLSPLHDDLQRALHRDRARHDDRTQRGIVRRNGSRSGVCDLASCEDRRPVSDRSRQWNRRSSCDRDRQRRVDRSSRVHHGPEPRLRRSGRADLAAVATRVTGDHRGRELARSRNRGVAGCTHRTTRRRGCEFGRLGRASRSLRGCRCAGTGDQEVVTRRRLAASLRLRDRSARRRISSSCPRQMSRSSRKSGFPRPWSQQKVR